jgi:uncharacterized protein
MLRRYPAPIRVLAFVSLLALMWLPFVVPIQLAIGRRDPNLAGIITLIILYTEFLCLSKLWGRQVHKQQNIFWHYGLEFTQQSALELSIGLGVGLSGVLVMFGLQTSLGWVQLHLPTVEILRFILEGLLVSLAFGFAEELFFRGWLLDELQRDYIPTLVLWANAVLFALFHLRVLTFLPLVLLGVALVWAKRSRSETRLGWRRDRLALPIGLHAGLVWGNYIFEVGKLISYTGRVPAWITGLDRNPVSGLMGLLMFGSLAVGVWQYAKRQRPVVRL